MIVVTGAAGFIGSRIIAGLNQEGTVNILAVDLLRNTEKWQNLRNVKFADYMDKFTFLKKIQDEQFDDSNLKAIFHMGACSDTTEKNVDYLMENNFEYTKQLALWAIRHKVRFIYASSAATYGAGEEGYSDRTELETLRPLNPYGYSKQLFDLWARRKNLSNSLVGLKFFNVYGPHEAHKGEMRSVVHKSYGQILSEGKVRLFKSHHPDYQDGEQVRDFIYVEDAVKVALFFIKNPKINGIYNVGTGKARSFKDLVTAVFHALEREPNIEYIDMPEYLREKYQYFTESDPAKLRSVGYQESFFSLEEGIRDYVLNYLIKGETQ